VSVAYRQQYTFVFIDGFEHNVVSDNGRAYVLARGAFVELRFPVFDNDGFSVTTDNQARLFLAGTRTPFILRSLTAGFLLVPDALHLLLCQSSSGHIQY
jgi:hypothetical protein